ncbi:ubiquinone biosynthesis protein COQ9, mitochondrial-like [Glandiceps talaboti]
MAYSCGHNLLKTSLLLVTRTGLRRCIVNGKQSLCTATNNNGNGVSGEEIYEDGESEQAVETRILNTALSFVPIHGWSRQSLAEAVKAEGYPSITHGMFPRGGGDLVHFFVRNCNEELAASMSSDMKEREADETIKMSTTTILRDATESRLRMITPYIDTWPQAMALTALPENIQEHFKNLGILMDDMWFYAGDKSTDFNWYTKRASLAVVYKSTEMFMIQDSSFDFEETWSFLDRRLADAASFGHLSMGLRQFTGNFGTGAQTVFETARNMAGLNSRNR